MMPKAYTGEDGTCDAGCISLLAGNFAEPSEAMRQKQVHCYRVIHSPVKEQTSTLSRV